MESRKNIERERKNVVEVSKLRNTQQQYVYHLKFEGVNFILRCHEILCRRILDSACDSEGDKVFEFDQRVYVDDFFTLARRKDTFLEVSNGDKLKIVFSN